MIALIQRVKRASVTVGDHVTGQIEQGLLVLLCAGKKRYTGHRGETAEEGIGVSRIFRTDGQNESLGAKSGW